MYILFNLLTVHSHMKSYLSAPLLTNSCFDYVCDYPSISNFEDSSLMHCKTIRTAFVNNMKLLTLFYAYQLCYIYIECLNIIFVLFS